MDAMVVLMREKMSNKLLLITLLAALHDFEIYNSTCKIFT
jgi:hypothetical protein